MFKCPQCLKTVVDTKRTCEACCEERVRLNELHQRYSFRCHDSVMERLVVEHQQRVERELAAA
jgi:hypothetical protein